MTYNCQETMPNQVVEFAPVVSPIKHVGGSVMQQLATDTILLDVSVNLAQDVHRMQLDSRLHSASTVSL